MMSDSVRRPPNRGRYLVQNSIGYLILANIDFFLSISRIFRRKNPKNLSVPRKILLSNGAHLGDVLLSTGILRLLREIFPDIQIGFLAASWSRQILLNHPLLDHLHTVDHWKLNRSRASLREKVLHYMRTSDIAGIEIKNIGYDVAIDLYPYFPNNIPFRVSIPRWKKSWVPRTGHGSFSSQEARRTICGRIL